MRAVRVILEATTVAAFLLFMLVPQCTAAPNLVVVQSAVHRRGDGSLWDKISKTVTDTAAAVSSKIEDLKSKLPPWEEIVASAKEFLEATEENLSTVGREFNVTGKVDEFRSTFDDIVYSSGEIRQHVMTLTHEGLTLDQISDELGVIFNEALEHLKKAFPPPDQAPTHEERQMMLASVFDKAEQGLLDFFRNQGMSEEGLKNFRQSFDNLKPHIEKLVLITGDLIEQHPVLFDTLIFSAVAMLIPESWILRSLLSVIGFGPYGPIKGSPAAWAQQRFWGAAVAKGSWFAFLQKMAMTL